VKKQNEICDGRRLSLTPVGQKANFPDVNTHPAPPELEGRILLADPSLRDGSFNKSVILLADYSAEEGAFGLILNHPSGQTVGDLLSDSEFDPLSKVAVHVGGPVSRGQLTFGAFWDRDSKFGYAVRISAEEAIAYLNQPGTLVRAFAGYSGWSRNQLEDEVEQNAWTVIEPKPNLLSRDHDVTLWKSTMCELSPYHRILANAPDEILAN
jgi:putative transcriptional regulator